VAPITQKGNAMVPQFVPSPTAWALRIEYQPGSPAHHWAPEDYPVIGWQFDPERQSLGAWISYKGEAKPLSYVLADIKIRAEARARTESITSPGNATYTLVPV
jgi:hypothetical protein